MGKEQSKPAAGPTQTRTEGAGSIGAAQAAQPPAGAAGPSFSPPARATETPPPPPRELRRERLRCTLQWQTRGTSVIMDLAAYIAGPDGLQLGCVVGRSAEGAEGIEDQFRQAGVRHLGAAAEAPPGAMREEHIELDFGALAQADLFRHIFVVCRHRVDGDASVLERLSVQVSIQDGPVLFSSELLGERLPRASGSTAFAAFAHTDSCWYFLQEFVELTNEEVDQEAALQETLSRIGQAVDARVASQRSAAAAAPSAPAAAASDSGASASASASAAPEAEAAAAKAEEERMMREAMEASEREAAAVERRKNASAKSEEEAFAAALAASAQEAAQGSSASPDGLVPQEGGSGPALSEEDQQLMDFVKMYEGNGNWRSAIEAQEKLLKSILEYQDRDGEEKWQQLFEIELYHMDELRTRDGNENPTPTLPSSSSRRKMDASGSSNSPAGAAGAKPALPPAAAEKEETTRTCAVLFHAAPFTPSGGSSKGGARIKWTGEGPPPADVYVGNAGDGKPCAPLADGVFVVPRCVLPPGQTSDNAKVRTIDEAGSETIYLGGFTYWTPGEIRSIEPARGPVTGDREVRITTSDLAGDISQAWIGEVECEIVGLPTSTEVVIRLPAAEAEAAVSVRVQAPNSNGASSDAAFTYFVPEVFGSIGERVQLSDEDATATRVDGVNAAICVGAFPMRRFPQGRYFELSLEEKITSMRCIAVGVTVARPEDDFHESRSSSSDRAGRFVSLEAKELERVWLAGYDKAGSLFISDGEETKIPTSTWRAASQVKPGTRLGVLWAEEAGAAPALVIFQDGVERVRLSASGRLPDRNEELFALVDLQGSAKRVRLIPGSSPPAPPAVQDDVG